MPHNCVILLLAAGTSSRMRGGDKLLETIEGETLLRRQVRVAKATGAEVMVVLPINSPMRRAQIAFEDVQVVEAKDPSLGMSASIAIGVASLPRSAEAVMILPTDMPDLSAADLNAVLSEFAENSDTVHRGASENGQPGHPVVFPRRLFPVLKALSGDDGARAVLESEVVRLVPLPNKNAVTDLDTPEEWQSWRNGGPNRSP